MNIHHYENFTKEYVKTTVAKVDPEDNTRFLHPANSTIVEPNVLNANQANVFNEETNTWDIVADYRNNNSYFLLVDGSPVTFALGEEPDGTMSTELSPEVQALLDEALRVNSIISEAVLRMNLQAPVGSFKEIEFYKEFWLSIAPAARQPTAKFQLIIDIHSAAKNAVANSIEFIDVAWP